MKTKRILSSDRDIELRIGDSESPVQSKAIQNLIEKLDEIKEVLPSECEKEPRREPPVCKNLCIYGTKAPTGIDFVLKGIFEGARDYRRRNPLKKDSCDMTESKSE